MATHVTRGELAAVCAALAEAEPTAILVRNGVGNLVYIVDGEVVGYIDLMGPSLHRFDEFDED